MIYERIGDLLSSTEINALLQQNNLLCSFGAGLAKAIKDKFPEAYEADCKTIRGDINKLGTYSVALITDPKDSTIKRIYNLYSQTGIGGSNRQTSYDAMVLGLERLKSDLEYRQPIEGTIVLGIPYKLGCGLANGNWTIVKAIIDSIFSDAHFDVYIYYLPEFAHEMSKNKTKI